MRIQYLGPLVLGAIAAVLVVVSFSPTSNTLAEEPYLTDFIAKYGTGSSKLNNCDVCHLDPRMAPNPYGDSFHWSQGLRIKD
jgi:hypothetical protein